MNADKPVHAHNVPTPVGPSLARGQVPRENIARRAEELWRERGQPAGSDEAIWLEAEAELKAKSEMKPVAGTDTRVPAVETPQPAKPRTKSRDAAEAHAETTSRRR